MIRNYIIIAWRNLLKNKLFSFINIFGLALSMSVCMMVIVRIIDNFQYDNFHVNGARIYRVLSEITNGQGDKWKLASTPLPLRDKLAGDSVFAEAVSLYPVIHENATDGVKEIFVNGMLTQPSFFRVFGFRLLHGDERTALDDPKGVVISKNTSAKFFGIDNPVGKTLTLGKLGSYEITGVLDSPPGKSHIQSDVFIPYNALTTLENNKVLSPRSQTWDSFEYGYTFVLLHEGFGEKELDRALSVVSDEINKDANEGRFVFLPQRLSSITPGSNDIYNDIGARGSWGKLLTEVGIALIILFAACFNYTNLSLARALTRAKEVGIRKVAGALRRQIFAQYIIEAVLVALFALLVAQAILSFILEFKPFNDGYEFMPEVQISFQLAAWFMTFTLIAGLIAGAMPAWILSSFRPASILKNISVHRISGSITLRKVLMVFQFSLSLVILIFLTSFYRQFDFMANADAGFKREGIVTIPVKGENTILAAELERLGEVEQVALMSTNFGGYPVNSITFSRAQGEEKTLKADFYFADAAAIRLMGLELVAGSNFRDRNSSIETEVVVNEKTVSLLGFKDNAGAIGEKLYIDSTTLTIVGVIKDFYHSGVGRPINVLLLRNNTSGFRIMNLKVNQHAGSAAMANIKKVWKKIYPDTPFEYSWLDKTYQAENDQTATISLLGFLAFMTVVIAVLGLLGLVVYTVETKKKEISIRKVIGATAYQLVTMLSKGFASLLLIAGGIAIPLGYLLSQFFLMNFANRISVGGSGILLCFVLLLVTGLAVILPQTYRASQENPSRNLTSE